MAGDIISSAGSALGIGGQKAAVQASANIIQMKTSDFISMIIIVAMLAISLTAIILYVYRNVYIPKRFNYDVKLEYLTKDGRVIVRNTKGRIKYDRKEPHEFRFKGSFYRHLHAPLPPDNVKEIKAEGRVDVVGRVLNDQDVIWLERKLDKDKLKDTVQQIQPITQEQRSSWVNQNRKAERDKVWSIGQLLMQMLPFILLIVVMVILFVFWKQITAPSIQALDLHREIKSLDIKIIDKLNVLYKIQNGSKLTPYDMTVFNDTEENRFNSVQKIT